jgi:hypothetical protein
VADYVIFFTTFYGIIFQWWWFTPILQVPIAIGGPGLLKGCQFRTDLPTAGLANVAATFINLLGFEAPKDYEPSLIEVVEWKPNFVFNSRLKQLTNYEITN